MRVAFWSPLPPEGSGIADYSYRLLADLREHVEVTAVVKDRSRPIVPSPSGLEVPSEVAWRFASEIDHSAYECHVYNMGNHAEYHAYMHRSALAHPGLLVLHDPSLVDFYTALCGGAHSPTFLEEVRYNIGPVEKVPTIAVDGRTVLDHLRLLLTRRLVESSLATIVHSEWARATLTERSPTARVYPVPLAAAVLPTARSSGSFRVGILGGMGRHKRIPQAIRAFREFHARMPASALVIAGRTDDAQLVAEITGLVNELALEPVTEIHHDLEERELDDIIASCDALLSLRWPTAGETSAIMMRAFGAGVPVLTSDVPQFREFSEVFCFRAPLEERAERKYLVDTLLQIARDPILHERASGAAREFVTREASFSAIATRYVELIRDTAGIARRVGRTSGSVPLVVNAIGCWSGTTGLMEAARRTVSALSTAGISVALTNKDIGIPKDPSRVPADIASLTSGRPGSITVCFLNINELDGVTDEFLRKGAATRLIASWYWELSTLPSELVCELERFDEIWVASRFVAANLQPYTTRPVLVVPPVVEVTPGPARQREDFGLPPDKCLFLFHFDANSVLARKNPWGLIEAFEMARNDAHFDHNASLVVKTMNLSRLPEASFELRRRLESIGAVLIDDHLAASEMTALTALCDVYVSLHRAEGFGLGIAEAMLLGLPAVATNYSGNTDFMDTTNSCPVGFRLREINVAELRYNPSSDRLYQPGMAWAEPDLGQAAEWMRLLARSPELRRQIASRAAETIRSRFSSAAVGTHLRRRLSDAATASSQR